MNCSRVEIKLTFLRASVNYENKSIQIQVNYVQMQMNSRADAHLRTHASRPRRCP